MSRGASRINPSRSVAVEKTAGGAMSAKLRLSDRLRSYCYHHLQVCLDALRRLRNTPLQTLMTCLVLAIALALPASLWLALNNIQHIGERWDAAPKISVYLNLGSAEPAIDLLLSDIVAMPEVASVDYISAQAALLEFQNSSTLGKTLSSFEENPLPPTLVVMPVGAKASPERLQALAQRIAKSEIVDDVGLDMQWLHRLYELMALGEHIVMVLAVLLGLGALLAIGNTIRLAIENRRDEIVVTKLVGATDAFVRRPFVYAGAWYGCFGGILACAIVLLVCWALSGPIDRLVFLYESDFEMRGLGWMPAFELLCVSILIGWLGAWLAVGRHLSDIEPK